MGSIKPLVNHKISHEILFLTLDYEIARVMGEVLIISKEK